MNIEQTDSINYITDAQNDVVALIMKLTHEYKTFENQHLVIDISTFKELTSDQINMFIPLSKTHKKNNKSFILIAPHIDFNKISDKLSAVPTKIEALDIINMEDIERDMGF